MDAPLFDSIIIVFGLAILILFVCTRLRIPAIVGFLITGMLVGPHALGLIPDSQTVSTIAEIGIILLLFTIGMEFSFQNLLRIRRAVLIGGSVQVLLTIAVVAAVAMIAGLSVQQAIFFGFLLSLSSTAIVLSILQGRSEVESPHGRTALGILIFQDLVIIPMMLLVPILAGEAGEGASSIPMFLLTSVAILGFVIVSARWLVPYLLFQVARLRSKEIFLLSIVVICLFTAWLTASAGLSLSLGAFLAGLIISESEYSHEALGAILPFKDVFTSFFFISVGMLLNIGFLLENPAIILALTAGIVLLKAAVAGTATLAIGYSLRTAVLAGLSISQIGEFSFVLSESGASYGLIDNGMYQGFLAVTVISMIATPFLIDSAPRAAERAMRLSLPTRIRQGTVPETKTGEHEQKDHIIIIGFGLGGRNVARAARAADIPYVIVETNPETVREERDRGEPIHYGDATRRAVLAHAGIAAAKVLVIVISDPTATRRIVAAARRANPHLRIIARTRYMGDIAELSRLGADEVVPEEFVTSIEIFSRILSSYLVPRDEIERFAAEVRTDGYVLFRSSEAPAPALEDIGFYRPGAEIESLRVSAGAPISDQSLGEMNLRRRFGVTVLAIRRGAGVITAPCGDTRIEEDDICVVIGPEDRIADLEPLFRGEENGEENGR
ncbi:cation:proton antiporter domain-containing protein [Methanofollis fontis]|uniref:Potassium transporter KefB n=1 Tax=Methanofollis fontis TaxID=2052832 RepID=A0A483CZ76_9EURY|nr:cation:proton antiporter [Methanofollis fontis]TAJ45329.1 potassium transporter KefB [Methanofollis fontis]